MTQRMPSDIYRGDGYAVVDMEPDEKWEWALI